MSDWNRDDRFDKWVESLPASHWAKYDLSACRLGWDAATNAADRVIKDAEPPQGEDDEQ